MNQTGRPLEQRLVAFSEIAKKELVRVGFGKECLAASRISVDVLKRAGLAVKPLTVMARAVNAKFLKQVEHLRRFPQRNEFWPGASSVGIGYETPGEWTGHLVVIVEAGYLLDLTLDQAARRKHKIRLPPFLVWQVNREFLEGKAIVELGFGDPVSTYASYKACPDDLRYAFLPLWNSAELKPVADRISELWNDRG